MIKTSKLSFIWIRSERLIKKDKKIDAMKSRMVVIRAGLMSRTITLLNVKAAPHIKPKITTRMKLTCELFIKRILFFSNLRLFLFLGT